jgi:hypothetical protein
MNKEPNNTMKEKIKKATKRLRLKVAHKDKRRYFTTKTTTKKVEQALYEYLGILGMARAAYIEVKDKELPKTTIGSCLTTSLNDIRTALSLSGIPITKVSGTIAGLKR